MSEIELPNANTRPDSKEKSNPRNKVIGLVLAEFTEHGPVPIATYFKKAILTEDEIGIICTKSMIMIDEEIRREKERYMEKELYGPFSSVNPDILLLVLMFQLPYSDSELKLLMDPRMRFTDARLTLILLLDKELKRRGQLVCAELTQRFQRQLSGLKSTEYLRQRLEASTEYEKPLLEGLYNEAFDLLIAPEVKSPLYWHIEKHESPSLILYSKEGVVETNLEKKSNIVKDIHHVLSKEITSYQIPVPEFTLYEWYSEGVILMYSLIPPYMLVALWHEEVPKETIKLQKSLIEFRIRNKKAITPGKIVEGILGDITVVSQELERKKHSESTLSTRLSHFFSRLIGSIFGSSRKSILILGASGVGKTTMVQSMKKLLNEGRPLSETEVEAIQKTFGVEYDRFNFKGSQIEARDIAGDKSLYEKLYLEVLSVRDPDGVVYVVDPILDLSIQCENLEYTLRYLPGGVPVVICVNKSDMMNTTNASLYNPLRVAEIFDFPRLAGKDSQYQIFQTSAITGRGVLDALDWIVLRVN